MDPVTAAAISGGTSGALSIVGTAMSNQQSAAQAQRQMDFQERMSNTAHQREVEDLRKAGLNPILSALGQGASTPQGAQGTVNDFGPGISKGFDTAIAVRNLKADLDVKEQTVDNMRDSSFGIVADTKKKWEEIKSQKLNNVQTELQTHLLRETIPHAIKEAKAKGDWSQVNQLMGIIKSGASSASDILNLFNPIKGK